MAISISRTEAKWGLPTYAGPKELIEEARRRGLWLHCTYQDLWFSPDQLEAENKNGKFRWGPVNWRLRDPHEYAEQAERRAQLASQEAARIRALVAKA